MHISEMPRVFASNIAFAAQRAMPHVIEESQNGNATLICIIDDDDWVGDSFSELLKSHGFDAIAYRSPAEFLADQRQVSPQCLIVDQNMPGMDGLTLIADLRDRKSAVPCILITDRPDPAVARRAETLGVHAILEKPFAAAPLLDLVRRILAKA